MKLLILFLLILSGCKEFYDEDFKDLESTNQTVEPDEENRTYSVDLRSTDPNLKDLVGSADLMIEDNGIEVSLSVEGIPSNMIQLHYSYTNTPCSALNLSLPADLSSRRSYSITEKTTLKALENDLRSIGIAQGAGDINLLGRSFVVKAFSNFTGIPNPGGTNQLTILCGLVR